MKHIPQALAALFAVSLSFVNAADPKDADNTDRNKRDKSETTKKPTDQSNTKEDIKLTADIRKLVMKDKSLSSDAKNCKIITAGGKVTLRGPVKTAEEKAAIENYAVQAAGTGKVDNQLEVKAAK